jgi:MoxR-like ATPase
MSDWRVYRGTQEPHDGIQELPSPPSWRDFTTHKTISDRDTARGKAFQANQKEIDLINTALYLRRPLLITGKPGTGKSSLAYSVAYELKLGNVLRWSITSRSTLAHGLYTYDAIGRLQEANRAQREREANPGQDAQTGASEQRDIGRYLRLGPLGTALLPAELPRVLLIDEIDKSDIDLPNDLLHIFEEGEFEIPELMRLPEEIEQVEVFPWDNGSAVQIVRGRVRCHSFPFVVFTSNGEREFPPAFLRRCLRIDIDPPDETMLIRIVQAHLGEEIYAQAAPFISMFLDQRERDPLATDQLLNAIYLASRGVDIRDQAAVCEAVLRALVS